MADKYIPINKGNYSMETPEREELYEIYRGEGWEEEYKEYRSNWVKYAKEQVVSEYPTHIDLELSTACNLKCPMCYTILDEFKNHVSAEYMDFELFKKVVDEISSKVPSVRLSLRGEASLHPKFIDCIEYAKSKGVKEVSTLTNGSRLDQEFFTCIMKSGIDLITVSIDGMGETYENIRKPLKFDDIYQKIKDVHKVKSQYDTHRPLIKIQTIWPAIEENPERFYDAFAPYVDLVAFNPLADVTSIHELEDKGDFSCPQIYQRLVIGSNGLALCCANDLKGEVVVGDLSKETVYDIWHGDKMNRIREMMKEPDGYKKRKICRNCLLPKSVEPSSFSLKGREFTVLNYVKKQS